MTPTQTAELKKLAEAATPGPWRWLNSNTLLADYGRRKALLTVSSHNKTPYLSECDSDGYLANMNPQGPNASFIAAANPTAVLALIEKLERAIDALEWYANWDWSDKYVQAVPLKARTTLQEITGGARKERG